MLQHSTSAGWNQTQQPHSTASVLTDAELPSLSNIDAVDEGFDLLGKFLSTGDEIKEWRFSVNQIIKKCQGNTSGVPTFVRGDVLRLYDLTPKMSVTDLHMNLCMYNLCN